MIQLNCYRCSQSSISTDGVRCSLCDNAEASKTSIIEKFHTLVSETGNASPVYRVSASDASTQTTDDDFFLFELTQNASTQTTDSDFSLLAQTDGCQEYAEGGETIRSPQVEIFDQDSAENQNLLPENANIKKDDFLSMNIDRYNPTNFGPSLECIIDARVDPKQCAYLHEHPPSNRRQNKHNRDNIFKIQSAEYTEQINEVGKLNFVGSVSFLSENPMPNFLSESSVAVNQHGDSQEETENSLVLSGKRTDASVRDHFSGNLATKREILEQKTYNFGKIQRSIVKKKVSVKRWIRCRKCAKRCKSESTLNAHLRNNCNQNYYKCDQCGKTFPAEINLLCHELVHTTEKTFKCDQCDFTNKLERHLKSHKERCHKELICQSEILKIALMICISLCLAILYRNLQY